MIKKQTLKTRPVCKVTFEVPPEVEADKVEVMGDFTDWDPVPLKQLKSGKWKLKMDLDQDERFQFRYRIENDGEVSYRNEPEADDYVPNEFGSENSVIETR